MEERDNANASCCQERKVPVAHGVVNFKMQSPHCFVITAAAGAGTM